MQIHYSSDSELRIGVGAKGWGPSKLQFPLGQLPLRKLPLGELPSYPSANYPLGQLPSKTITPPNYDPNKTITTIGRIYTLKDNYPQ